jgi:cytochrome c oxidase cbb3-type subunit III
VRVPIRQVILSVALAMGLVILTIHLHAQAPSTGYPQRPPADAATIERGRMIYSTNCAFCHGNDARGGDGGPNLLRSDIVLNDKSGELIGDILRNGVSTMPKFELSKDQVADVAAFIHSFRVNGYDASRLRPQTIVIGDAKAGEAYFKAKCASCHDVAGDLKGFAARINDERAMQQTWLMPGARGTRPSKPAPTTVRATLESGQQVEGQLVRIDDFIVSLVTADDAQYTIRRDSKTAKVEVRDPLQAHKELLRTYTDKDIHNVTAYLGSFR